VLVLLMLSILGATPAHAPGCSNRAGECLAPPYAVPAEPVWATVNAVPGGNYPGSNLEFHVFVINSGHPPGGNVTLFNETLTAAALPPALNTSVATGLPLSLAPGQAITSTIALQIPSNFAQNNFTANLVVDVSLWNGTTNIPLKLTGSTIVYILGPPAAGPSTTSTTSQVGDAPPSGGVSTALFAAGVAIPSIVAVILLFLLVQRRGRQKGGT
jgi:hypothetical protein